MTKRTRRGAPPRSPNAKSLWNQVMAGVPSGQLRLGRYFSAQLLKNPRHLLFTLARYKFAARLLEREKPLRVLELGCNEGLGTLLLAEVAKNVVAVDFDEAGIAWAKENLQKPGLRFVNEDFLKKTYGSFGAVVALDVFEHIPPQQGPDFFKTVNGNLNRDGFLILGVPNQTAEKYASKPSRIGHVNLNTAETLKKMCLKHFQNVFSFGMNDEVLHTGFHAMCHYLFVLAITPKKGRS